MSRPIRSAAPTRLTASDRRRLLLRSIGCRRQNRLADVLAILCCCALVGLMAWIAFAPHHVRAFLLSIVGGTP